MWIEFANKLINLERFDYILTPKGCVIEVVCENGEASYSLKEECENPSKAQTRYEEIKNLLLDKNNEVLSELKDINENICGLYEVINPR